MFVNINGSWKLEVGSWKLEVGSWKLEVGSWKLEANDPFRRKVPNPKAKKPMANSQIANEPDKSQSNYHRMW